MRRLHLFEIEDQPWLPASIRDTLTDYLRFALQATNPYRVVVPRLAAALARSGATTIIDMGAGGGGPWSRLLPALREHVPGLRVTLTDLYPNLVAFQRAAEQEGVAFEAQPVDATAMPARLAGFRTMCSSFHHLPPPLAQAVLADAVRQNAGIAVLEATKRDLPSLASMLLTPLITLFVIPAIRPFRWSRLLWTYLLPAVLVIVPFDGLVSCLRTYSPADLRELLAGVPGAEGYVWEIGEEPVPGAPTPVTYLIGLPRAPGSAPSAH